MATGIYTINTDKGSATVYQNPDNTVTVSSGDKKWTGSQADFNTAYGKAAGANPTSNVTVRNLDSGKSATVNAGVTANAAATASGPKLNPNPVDPNEIKTSNGEQIDPMVKALAEANARAAKAEADRKATIAAAEKLQADTKKATDAVSAGQTQAAVNAEMGKDATQTTTDSASADYQNALATAISTKPAVSEKEKKTIEDEETKRANAVQAELDALKINQEKYSTERNKLLDSRKDADIVEAKANEEFAQKKLEIAQREESMKREKLLTAAKTEMARNRQVAKLNMMKLGLVGSGAAISTLQSIADNGIAKLAQIEAESSIASEKIAIEAKRESDKLIYDLNKISDNYVEKRLAANKEDADFIAKTQRSTTENQLQRDERIRTRIKEAQKQQKEDQEWMLKLYKERADQAQLAEDRLQKKADKLKADGKDKIKMLTDTGAWAKLSPEERAKLETDAGMPLGTSRMIIGKLVGEDVQKLIDDQGIKGYFPSGAAMDKLNSRVDQLLELGKDRVTATNIAFGELAQADPALKAALAKANALKAGSGKSDFDKQTVELSINGKTQKWALNANQAAGANAAKAAAQAKAEKEGKDRSAVLYAGNQAYSNYVEFNGSPIEYSEKKEDAQKNNVMELMVGGRKRPGVPTGRGDGSYFDVYRDGSVNEQSTFIPDAKDVSSRGAAEDEEGIGGKRG
jgi:predicted nucleotidyltransferase component of viral defense system